MSSSTSWISAGAVGRAHGLDGSFYVTRPRPELLAGPLYVEDEPKVVVRRAGTDAKPILRLEGVEGRGAVEALRGAQLLVPRSAAPPLEPGEYWAEDLEGARVVDGERELGVVSRLVGLPSCEALEVGDLLIPMVGDAIRSVDVDRRVIDVDAGFLGA